MGRGGDWWRRSARATTSTTRSRETARAVPPARRDERAARRRCPTASSACWRSPSRSPAKPRVLLLDEPAAGVPEGERHEILATVAALPRDVTVLLIEHDMDLVFSLRRPHLGAGQRRGVGRRHAGRDRARPAVKAVYLGEGRRWLSSSPVEGLSAGYGEAVVLHGLSLRAAGRPVAGAARPQRHRQDHADQLHRRRHAPHRRHHHARRARHHRHAAGPARARPASAGCRRSATSSSR